MTPLAALAIAALTLWALASVCFTLGIPWVCRVVAPSHRIRLFGTWSMFAAGPGRKGAYALAYRDLATGELEPPWTVAAVGYHWSWHGFLLDPRRTIADAVHTLGKAAHHNLQHLPDSSVPRQIEFIQAKLEDYLMRLVPPRPRCVREIRVIRQFAASDAPPCEVVLQFCAPHNAGRR